MIDPDDEDPWLDEPWTEDEERRVAGVDEGEVVPWD